MPTAACDCGWSREYALLNGAKVGLARHGAAHGVDVLSARSIKASATMAEREAQRWVERAGDAGHRSDAEWVAHPYALDDLLRVLDGTSLRTIAYERRLAAERRAG